MKYESGRGTLVSLALCMLLPSLGTSIANVALPTLATAFGTTSEGVKWIVVAYLVAVTVLIVPAGRLGDIIGRRRLLLVGIALFAIGSLLCALAPTLPLLIAARAVQGCGAALMLTLTTALMEPRAMGILGTTSAVGTALGPSLGGFLDATFGWRSLFLVKVPLTLAALVLAAMYVPKDSATLPNATRGMDIRGTVLVTLRNRIIATGLVATALVSTVVMATLIVGPFYLTMALDLDPRAVGLTMSTGPIIAALTSAPAGRLVARVGAARVTTAGLCGVLAGSLLFALLPRVSGVAGYIIPLVIVTAAYAAFQTANNTAVMTAADERKRGVVSGMLNLSRYTGLIVGASAMGTVFSMASSAAGGEGGAAASVGMRTTFAVAAALMVLALAGTFSRAVLPRSSRYRSSSSPSSHRTRVSQQRDPCR